MMRGVTTSPGGQDGADIGDELQGHLGQHSGSRYRPGYRPLARGYWCDLCPDQAAFWDHCHDHGLIRGPLCRSCNGSEFLWVHTNRGVQHLMRCPGCQEAGHPRMRNRIARIGPTLRLVMDLSHPGETKIYCHGGWEGEDIEESWTDVFRDLSGGYLNSYAVCSDKDCDARWRLSISRADFELLDTVRLAAGLHLPGQPMPREGPRWVAENTPVFWMDVPQQAVPPDGGSAWHQPVTVVIPGLFGLRLERVLGLLLEKVTLGRTWTRRGRSSALELTAAPIGLVALHVLLRLPYQEAGAPVFTQGESRGWWQAAERIRAALRLSLAVGSYERSGAR